VTVVSVAINEKEIAIPPTISKAKPQMRNKSQISRSLAFPKERSSEMGGGGDAAHDLTSFS
jgi:hypothetical protein